MAEEEKKYIDGENCEFEKGDIVEQWSTGDDKCNATSYRYECGGVYNHNFMDVVGNRDHDCFWECQDCPYQREPKI